MCCEHDPRFVNAIARLIPAGKVIRVILDDHTTHKHLKVLCLARPHPRSTVHLMPTGGYTRVLKVRYRTGDAAPLSIVELVDGPVETRPAKKKSPAKKAAPARKTSAKADRPASKAKKASSKKASAKKTTAKKAVSKKAATVKASTKKATRKKSD